MSITRAWKFLAAYWLEGSAAEKPATGSTGYVPILQADDTVKWARPPAPNPVLTNHTTPEIVYSRTGDVIYSRGS